MLFNIPSFVLSVSCTSSFYSLFSKTILNKKNPLKPFWCHKLIFSAMDKQNEAIMTERYLQINCFGFSHHDQLHALEKGTFLVWLPLYRHGIYLKKSLEYKLENFIKIFWQPGSIGRSLSEKEKQASSSLWNVE